VKRALAEVVIERVEFGRELLVGGGRREPIDPLQVGDDVGGSGPVDVAGAVIIFGESAVQRLTLGVHRRPRDAQRGHDVRAVDVHRRLVM